MSLTRNIYQLLRTGYRRLFRRQEDADTREAIEVLKKVTLFQDFSYGALHELTAIMHQRSYKRDEYLYYEDDPGLGLYIIKQGQVRLLTEDDSGTVYELGQATECDFFGELSLMGDFRRMETAQAVTETHVMGFFTPDLKTILKRNPQVGAAVVMALAQHLATRQVELLHLLMQDEDKAATLRGSLLRAV